MQIKYLKFIIILFFTFIFSINLNAQSQNNFKIDSLNLLLDNHVKIYGNDTLTISYLIELYKITKLSDPFLSVQYAARVLHIYREKDNKKGMALMHRYIADNYLQRNIYNLAMDEYSKSFELFNEVKDSSETAYSFLKIGDTYLAQKLDKNAKSTYDNATSLFDKLKDKKGLSYVYDKYSIIYLRAYDDKLALEYLNNSLKIRESLKNISLIALSCENIANTYLQLEDYETAADYLKKALQKYKLIGDEIKAADTYFNLGDIYLMDEKYEISKQNFEKALLSYIDSEIGINISKTQNRLSLIAFRTKNYKEALNFAEKASLTALTNDFPEIRQESYRLFADIFKTQGKKDLALSYLEKYIDLSDSLVLERLNLQSTELQVNLATQKKEQEIQILEKEQKLQNSELERRNTQQKGMLVGFILLTMVLALASIFGYYFYRTNKETKRANALLIEKNEEINQQKEEILSQRDLLGEANVSITKQRDEIEAKNDKIVSSMNYASRIQRAMLPKMSEIRKELPESFVMLSPKEAVSGDFFWYGDVEDSEGNKKIVIAAIDCTGHGIPGAFMSMIGDAYLNQIVFQQKITSPDEILAELHQGIRTALQQNRNENTDGMDVAICVIDKNKKQIEFAGAKNPLVYVQNNKMNVIKGDIFSIGGFAKEGDRNFRKHTINIDVPTWVYIYSDGFQDQFGGNESIKNRKYMAQRFREFLFQIHDKQINDQAMELAVELDDWRGEINQMDDVLIIGIKLMPNFI